MSGGQIDLRNSFSVIGNTGDQILFDSKNLRVRKRTPDEKFDEEGKLKDPLNLGAFFSAKIASSDRSVEAYLQRNRDIVAEDIENIDRQAGLLEAKYAAQAATAYKYGQNAAAGMRATSNANFLSNIADIALNMPLLLRIYLKVIRI